MIDSEKSDQEFRQKVRELIAKGKTTKEAINRAILKARQQGHDLRHLNFDSTTKNNDHWNSMIRDLKKDIKQREKTSKAGKASVVKRAKKSTWKSEFLEHYSKCRAKETLDNKASKSKIINAFINRNKKAPQDLTTYYKLLKK